MNVPAPYAYWEDEPGAEAAIASRAGHAPYAPIADGDFDTAACLSQMRADIQQRLGALLGETHRWVGQSADRADAADDHQQRHSDAHLASILLAELAQVERALRHLASGRYGICEDCGESIPSRRLERLPATTRCVGCQERSEARSEVRRVH